jgi:hypothetical protein
MPAFDVLEKQVLQPEEGGLASQPPAILEVLVMSEAEMWAEKRSRQAKDIEDVRSGRATAESMSWFGGGIAKNCKLIGSLF